MGAQQAGKAGPRVAQGGTQASQEGVLERPRPQHLAGTPQAQEEEEKAEVAGRAAGQAGRLTCRLVSCCCWCAMVCFTRTLLMLCSMAYFLACGRRR